MSYTSQQGISPPLANPGGAPIPVWVPPTPTDPSRLITPEAPGPVTIPQALDVATTFSPTIVRSTGKLLALAATLTVALIKSVGKILAIPTLPQEYYTFDGGVNGNTIATSDTGNGTQFDAVSIGATGAFIYDNAHAHSGALAGKVTLGGTVAATYAAWSGAFPDVTEAWLRVYVYMTGIPPALIRLMRFVATDLTVAAAVEITNTGKIRLFYQGTTGSVGTTTIPLNQWVRIELHALADASAGVVEAKMYTDSESQTAAETVSQTGLNTGSAQLAQALVGQTAAAGSSYSFWVDDYAASSLGWIGSNGQWNTTLTAMKVILKTLSVGLTGTVTLVKSVGKALSVSGSWVASLVRAPAKALAVTTTFTATLKRSAGKVLAVTVTATPTFARSVGKVLAVAMSWGVSVLKSVGKKLSATGTWTVTMLHGQAFLKALSVTVTFAASLSRSIGKKLIATGSWIATILGVKTVGLPSYFLPPVVEFLHSKDRFVMVTNEKDEQMPSLSAQWRYRQFYRGPVAQQRLTDEEGYYSVGAFKFRGGYWNGPLSGVEKAAIQAAGLGSRIRTATEPGLLPASID